MDRIIASGTTGSPPSAPVGSPGYPQNATVVTPYHVHALTEEIRNVIAAGSITPDTATLTQLRDAIAALITAGLATLAAIATSGSASDLIAGTVPAARLPNPGATTLGGVKSIAAATHKFVQSIGTDGLPVLAQPAYADLTGAPTVKAAHRSGAMHYQGEHQYTYTHNLGAAEPMDIDVVCWAKCTQADQGYSVGDVIVLDTTHPDNGNAMLTTYHAHDGNSTTLFVKANIRVVNLSTVLNVNLTADSAHWDIYVEVRY